MIRSVLSLMHWGVIRALCVLTPMSALILGTSSSAIAGRSLNLIQITTYSGNSNDYVDFNRSVGLGFGVILGLPVTDVLSIEPGLLYANRNFEELFQGHRGAINSKILQIPLTLKWRLLSWLSAGMGLYYSHSVGQLGIVSNGFEYKQDYNNDPYFEVPWQYNNSEWGWLASVAGKFALNEQLSLIGDLRYQRPLRWSPFYTSSDFQFFAGLQIGNIF